jgi:hypothetical protein
MAFATIVVQLRRFNNADRLEIPPIELCHLLIIRRLPSLLVCELFAKGLILDSSKVALSSELIIPCNLSVWTIVGPCTSNLNNANVTMDA